MYERSTVCLVTRAEMNFAFFSLAAATTFISRNMCVRRGITTLYDLEWIIRTLRFWHHLTINECVVSFSNFFTLHVRARDTIVVFDLITFGTRSLPLAYGALLTRIFDTNVCTNTTACVRTRKFVLTLWNRARRYRCIRNFFNACTQKNASIGKK